VTLLVLVAVACAGLFTGAAVYITLVEHPARLECGPELALREFAPSYRRAVGMQASLAVVGCLGGIGAWLCGGGFAFLLGGLVLGAVVPFTLRVLYPVNARLLDPTLAPASADAGELLARWGRLHAVRSVLGLAAFLIELGHLSWR
jgi:hypothetical protein